MELSFFCEDLGLTVEEDEDGMVVVAGWKEESAAAAHPSLMVGSRARFLMIAYRRVILLHGYCQHLRQAVCLSTMWVAMAKCRMMLSPVVQQEGWQQSVFIRGNGLKLCSPQRAVHSPRRSGPRVWSKQFKGAIL